MTAPQLSALSQLNIGVPKAVPYQALLHPSCIPSTVEASLTIEYMSVLLLLAPAHLAWARHDVT